MSEKRSFESHISADLPIKDKAEDRLNRGGFAEALANVIRSWRDKPSLVIGLFGDWGSGKTSLKNLVLKSIGHDEAKSLHVVEFSPWQVSGQELLSETFFREISKVLGNTGPSEEAVVKRRVARWKKYAGILSIAGTVARAFRSAVPPGDHIGLAITGAATSVESLASVAKTGAEALEAEGVTDSLTLSELKEQISEDLRSLDKPILVVLDDIDRLTKEEIRYTLQLVKANADFPNIIYLLLAQKKSVLDALKEIAPDNPLAYLEKIIQVSFDVPAVNRKQLQDVFVKGLDELLSGPGLEKRFASDYWGAIFPHLFSLLRNFRDLNRFLGTLAFHIQLFMNGDTFEVNPVDLIALEAIRLFEPEVYKRIPEAKDILTPLPRWRRDKEAEADKRRIEELVSLSSDANKDAIRDLLAKIFPPLNLRKGLRFQGDDVEGRWFRQLRVCSYQAFDRYFQFATPEGDVSQADIDGLLGSMGEIAELEQIFARLAERDLLDVMLTRVASLEGSLPLDHAATFLAALYQVKVGKRRYGFFESSPKDRVRSITYWYLQRLPEDQRLQVIEEALQLTRGLSFAIATVELLTHGPDPGSRALPFFEQQANRERLNQAGLEAIVRAASPDSQIPPEQMLLAVNFWARFDNTAAKGWLDAYLKSRSAIVSYLESMVSTSEGTGGTRRFIFVASFEHLISVEKIERRVYKYLNGELTADEAELVRLFRRGVKKRREGKDHPSIVWNEEDDSA
jgi:hypothetical protein